MAEKKPAACDPMGSTTRLAKPIFGSSFLSLLPVVPDDDTETKKKKKKKKQEMYRPWSQLSDDLLIEMIYIRLDFIEKFRMASVCVTWRRVAPEFARRHPQQLIPWLLFSYDTQTEALGVLNLPESMIHHLGLPQINMKLCRGSTEGWLFMFADERDNHCFLLNPFTKARIQLPPFNIESPHSVLKVILSSDPRINEDWMVVAQIESKGLLFCKSGDRSWSIGPPRSRDMYAFDDGDIIFLGGRVFALGLSQLLCVFYMEPPKFKVMTSGLSPLYDLHRSGYPMTNSDYKYISYLVASNEELFLVTRFMKNIKKPCTACNPLWWSECVECQTADNHYVTFKFLLHKLKRNENREIWQEYVWVKQTSLSADQALFLSRTGSKTVSIFDSSGLHGNSIYFTNDLHPGTGKRCDIGIYHVEDGQIEPFVQFDSYSFKCPAVWITPSI